MTTTPIQMRFADVDMLGHVNNVNQQHYFDVGKSDFVAQVLDPAPNWKQEGLITVSTYKRLSGPDPLRRADCRADPHREGREQKFYAFPADCQYRDTRGENPEPFRAGRF